MLLALIAHKNSYQTDMFEKNMHVIASILIVLNIVIYNFELHGFKKIQ
jgi:hypothetical protein